MLWFSSNVPDKLEALDAYAAKYSVYPGQYTPDPEPPEQIKAVDAEWLYELGIAWDERWGLEEKNGNEEEKARDANDAKQNLNGAD